MEIISSFVEQWKNRASTPFYGLLSFWWIALNFEYFNALLFVDEKLIYQKYGLLKNEYITQQFFSFAQWDWLAWLTLVLKILITLGMTYLMIWILPEKLLIRAYEKAQRYKNSKERVRLRQERELETERAGIQEQEASTLQAIDRKVQAQQSARQVWAKEFSQLRNSVLYGIFNQLIDSIYKYGGRTFRAGLGHEGAPPKFDLDKNLLAYAHSNELIEFDRSNDRLYPTEKGKYFISRYNMERQKAADLNPGGGDVGILYEAS